MSFIGIVTRKEKDNGVTAEAKIVTPSKKKAAKKQYQIRVKNIGLSDYECCVIDLATTKNFIKHQQDLETIKVDMNFPNRGDHDTVITYRIISADEARPITDYIDTSGKIIKRPTYGEGDVEGFLEIIVSKGVESVVHRTKIVVTQADIDEILNSVCLGPEAIWNSIRGNGGNALYENNGHLNIIADLRFITSTNELVSPYKQDFDKLSKTPATIAITVEDDVTIPGVSGSRILADGKVQQPSYSDACKLIMDDDITKIGTLNERRVRIGKIRLKITISLGDKTKELQINCQVNSKYLTNTEVADAILDTIDQFKIITSSDPSEITYLKQLIAPSPVTLGIGASEDVIIGLPANHESFGYINLNALDIRNDDATHQYGIRFRFNHTIQKYQKEGEADMYPSGIGKLFSASMLGSSSPLDSSSFPDLKPRYCTTIDHNVAYGIINAPADDNDKFTIISTLIVEGYSSNGITPSVGSSTTRKMYVHCQLSGTNTLPVGP